VVEVNRPDRAARRRHGKTDAVDAVAAAHAVLSGRATGTAKTGDGPVEMLRVFRLARTSAVKSRTQAINQLKAVIVGADPALRESLSGLSHAALIRYCANLAEAAPTDVATATCYTLRRLATRIQALTAEERQLQKHITAVLTAHVPQLLHRHGIGPDSAAALLITAGDNPDRMTTEASFAALCGVSPIEASSGKTRQRRLNRGGDRRANSALHHIALTRARCDQRTHDYLDRRIAVVLDGQPVGRIGKEQVRVFEVEPGEHRLHMRFVGLRRSDELRLSLKEGEERQFLCGSNGLGWPTLRAASGEDDAQFWPTFVSGPPKPGDRVPPN
jgi:transposase